MRENQPQPDSHIQEAANELQDLIRSRYPQAAFSLSHGDDPDGFYLETVVDLDDPDEVMDLVADRVLEMQVDQGLHLHVLPLRTPQRRQKLLDAQHAAHKWSHRALDPAALGL